MLKKQVQKKAAQIHILTGLTTALNSHFYSYALLMEQ